MIFRSFQGDGAQSLDLTCWNLGALESSLRDKDADQSAQPSCPG